MTYLIMRTKRRLKDEIDDNVLNDEQLEEYLKTAMDRVCLRLGVEELPECFRSIVVDISVKMYRRKFYEGISQESADTLSASFVDDILNEYTAEFEMYRKKQAGAVRFI